MGCLRAICACTHILSNKILSLLLLLFHQISGSSTRSEEEVSVFRVPLRGLGMPIDDLFCAQSRTLDSRPTCPVSAWDTQTCRTLHVSCMVAPLSSAVVYRRSYFLQFFPEKVERHRAPSCGTHHFRVTLPCGAEANCVAPRAVHQFAKGVANRLPKRSFCGWVGVLGQ